MNDSNTPGTNNEGSSEINDDNTSTSTGKKRKTSNVNILMHINTFLPLRMVCSY